VFLPIKNAIEKRVPETDRKISVDMGLFRDSDNSKLDITVLSVI
jgi:hypothetical protein